MLHDSQHFRSIKKCKGKSSHLNIAAQVWPDLKGAPKPMWRSDDGISCPEFAML